MKNAINFATEGSNSRPKNNIILLPHSAVGEGVLNSGKAKLYHNLGHKVYVSPESQLKSNPEAFEMLFLKNPYISGEKAKEEGDLVDGITVDRNPFKRNVFSPEILAHNLFSEEERKLKLYYQPQPISGLEDTTIIDLNVSTYRLQEFSQDCFENLDDYVLFNYPGALCIKRSEYNITDRTFEALPVSERFETISYNSIYDYCDIVSSCKKVVCLQTGSEMLACYYNDNVDCLLTAKNVCRPDSPNYLVFIDTNLKIVNLL